MSGFLDHIIGCVDSWNSQNKGVYRYWIIRSLYPVLEHYWIIGLDSWILEQPEQRGVTFHRTSLYITEPALGQLVVVTY